MKIFNMVCYALICFAALTVIIICGGGKASQIEGSETQYLDDYENYKVLQAEIVALDTDRISLSDIDGLKDRIERLPPSLRYEFDLNPYCDIVAAGIERMRGFIELMEGACHAEDNFEELISQIEGGFMNLRSIERKEVYGRYIEVLEIIKTKIENAHIREIAENVRIWQNAQLSSRDYSEVKQLLEMIDSLSFADRLTNERKIITDILAAIELIINENENITFEVDRLYCVKVARSDRVKLKDIELRISLLNAYDRELHQENLNKIREIHAEIDKLIMDIENLEQLRLELILVGLENLSAENLPRLYSAVELIDGFHEDESAALSGTREYFITVIEYLEERFENG